MLNTIKFKRRDLNWLVWYWKTFVCRTEKEMGRQKKDVYVVTMEDSGVGSGSCPIAGSLLQCWTLGLSSIVLAYHKFKLCNNRLNIQLNSSYPLSYKWSCRYINVRWQYFKTRLRNSNFSQQFWRPVRLPSNGYI